MSVICTERISLYVIIFIVRSNSTGRLTQQKFATRIKRVFEATKKFATRMKKDSFVTPRVSLRHC